MTMTTDDGRLSNLEGRIAEQSVAIQEVQQGIRQVNDRIDHTNREVNSRIDQLGREVNGRIDQLGREVTRRIDRVFLAVITIGAAQIGLLITFLIRNW